MRTLISLPVLAFVLTLVTLATSSATDVKVYFVATITLIDDGLCMCIPDDSISVGDTLTGFYLYDSDTPDSDPSGDVGQYLHNASPYSIEVHHARYSFGTDPTNVDLRIRLADGIPDQYQVKSWSNLPDPFLGPPVRKIELWLQDNSGTALSSPTLPVSAPDLHKWPNIHLLAIDGDGLDWLIDANVVWIGLDDPPTGIGSNALGLLSMVQNYPNPFSSSTLIEYELQTPATVVVTIYNIRGQRVAKIKRPLQPPGRQTITWNGLDANGRKVASGIYFYRLQAGGLSQTRKMVILK
jgi:hypothetical protein